MFLETLRVRLLKGGRGRVLVIVPLLLVSVHLVLLLYPFTCDQPQFCATAQADNSPKESTGSWTPWENDTHIGGTQECRDT